MAQKRLYTIDVLRGFSVVSMVFFHLCYDLVYISGINLGFFSSPFIDIWRASISWTFLGIAGAMSLLSRNNLKRALKYGSVALLIYIVTSFAHLDIPINFGIIYCMAASTLCFSFIQKPLTKLKPALTAGLCFAVFLVLLPLADGFVGIANLRFRLPQTWYQTEYFSFLGLPGPHFSSGDYYPLLPFFFMYVTGAALMLWAQQKDKLGWLSELRFRPLEFVGRHALEVYMLHQAVIFALLYLLGLV